jgi:hypothetical protein
MGNIVREAPAGLQLGFRHSTLPAMKIRVVCAALLALSLSPVFGSSKKPLLTVSFHPEANPRDGSSFATPANLLYLRRKAYITQVPSFNERQISTIFPFRVADGSWGCTFQLDAQGSIRLETMSMEQRGTALVVFVGTAGGQHQVVDMLIDQPVTTGRITVPRGLTDIEIAIMRKQFKTIGGDPLAGKKEAKKKKDVPDVDDGRGGETLPPLSPGPAVTPTGRKPSTPPPSKGKLRELDLPRVAD